MRVTKLVVRMLVLLAVMPWWGCGSDDKTDTPTGGGDFSQYSRYLEVRLVTSQGVNAVVGGFGGRADGTDSDPAADRLFVADPAGGGWYFVWFDSPNGGEATFTVRTKSVNKQYSKCRIAANDPVYTSAPIASSLFAGTSFSIGLEGAFDDYSLRQICGSVR